MGLVEVFLVGWNVWMVLSPCDMGVHVCLSPPDYGPIGWMLLFLGWVQADVSRPGVYGPGWPTHNCRNALIWVREDALSFMSSYLTIIADMSQLLFVSDNKLSLASRGPSIRCEYHVVSTTVPIRYCSLMSSNRGPYYTFSWSMSHILVHMLWFR